MTDEMTPDELVDSAFTSGTLGANMSSVSSSLRSIASSLADLNRVAEALESTSQRLDSLQIHASDLGKISQILDLLVTRLTGEHYDQYHLSGPTTYSPMNASESEKQEREWRMAQVGPLAVWRTIGNFLEAMQAGAAAEGFTKAAQMAHDGTGIQMICAAIRDVTSSVGNVSSAVSGSQPYGPVLERIDDALRSPPPVTTLVDHRISEALERLAKMAEVDVLSRMDGADGDIVKESVNLLRERIKEQEQELAAARAENAELKKKSA